MKGQHLDRKPSVAPTPPEIKLLLAVIQRANTDANYKPRPGVQRRSISHEDQQHARKFLAELQDQWHAR